MSGITSRLSEKIGRLPEAPEGIWSASYLWELGLVLAGVSALALVASYCLVPHMARLTHAAGIHGKDLHKRLQPVLPEAVGGAAVLVWFTAQFLLTLLAFMPFQLMTSLLVASYTFILGFADDVLDLRWRHKVVLSTMLSVPLLVAFPGDWTLALPDALRTLFDRNGVSFPLVIVGPALIMYTIFCVNAINIHAGVNGLEVGSSIAIALGGLMLNLWELSAGVRAFYGSQVLPDASLSTALTASLNKCPESQNHVFSILLLLPFVAVSLGLLRHNWYPASVFVGDSYTYFAGVVLAVAGLYGRYSASMFALQLPQLANFFMSLPQLIGLLNCPRHRLPRFNKATGCLDPVPGHLTLLNLTLYVTGPLPEPMLATVQILLQLATGVGVLVFNAIFFTPKCTPSAFL